MCYKQEALSLLVLKDAASRGKTEMKSESRQNLE